MSRATLSATPYSLEFKPTSIAGCQMWLDAADATTFTLSGSIITQWRDKSGSGNNATPFYTGPTLVQNVRNSLPGLSFSGGNMMKCGAFLTSTNFSAFIVVNNNSGTKVSLGVWKVQYSSYIITDVEIKVGSDLSANNKASVSIPDFTTTHIYGVTLSSSTVPGSTFIYNGSYDGLNTLVTGTSPSGNAATCAQEVSIGGLMESNSPLYMMTGYIHEVIFFSNTLTTNQRQQVEGYLAWKWGLQITLPINHPYYTSAPTAPNALGITRPAISVALAPTGVRSLGNAPYITTFAPTSIAGCQLWLDAADATTITGTSPVTQWMDKSGNSRTMTSVVGSGVLTYANNGIYCSNAYMFVTSPVNLINFSLFIVAKASPSSANCSLFVGRPNTSVSYNSTDGFGFYLDTTYTARLFINGNGLTNTAIYTNQNLYSYTVTSAGSISSWVNGNVGNSFGISARSTTAQGFALGAEWGGSSYGPAGIGGVPTNGHVYEVIVYSTALTSTQRQQIEGYLTWKWGLQAQLPNTHLQYAATPIGANLRPAISVALAPTGVRSLGNAPYITTFAPTSIAGCQLWYDAMDATTITQSSGLVSQLRDKSGNNRHISQATTGNQPSYANNTLTFNGSQYLTNTISSGISGNIFTGYIIYKPTSTSGNQRALFIIDSSSWIMIDNNVVAENANGIGAYTVTTISTTTPTIVAVTSASTYSLNGNAFSNLSTAYNQGNPTSINLGSGTSGGVPFNGSIYEVLVYNTVLTTNQCQQVEGYLAWKWGIQSSLPVFTGPTSITGCQLWLDGADATQVIYSTGSNISQWKDKSGNANHGSQSTAGQQPYYSTTSNAVVFSGAQVMTCPLSASSAIETCFFVFSTTNNKGVLIGAVTSPGRNIDFYESYNMRIVQQYNALVLSSSYTFSPNTTVLVTTQTTSTNSYIFMYGTQTDSNSAVANYGSGIASVIGTNGSDPPVEPFNGPIFEMIIFNTALTTTQRQQIEGYLATKWGLQASLPNTHPYYSSSPTHSYSATAPTGASLRPALSQALVPAGVRGLAAVRKLQSYTQTFSYTGANQTFPVPATTTSLTVHIWGAGGGGGHTGTQGATTGGAGAYVQGTLTVTPNNSLTIIVGGGGTHGSVGVAYGGGGSANAAGTYGGGGGRSAIQLSGTELVDAGGGGGAGYDASGGYANFSPTINGGAGYPGLTGASWPFDSGAGGTQTAGGAGGPGNASSYGVASPGTYLAGGAAAPYAGGGGSGYYGGGGGNTNDTNGAGGGGGSSYTTNPAFTLITGSNSSNGYSAPASASPYYASGVAAGSTNMTTGGNGRIVLVYLA